MKNFAINFAVLSLSTLAMLLVLEGVLRVWQPIEYRVKGDSIVLPVNRVYVIRPNGGYGLEDEVRHTKNSLGFRGPEKPADFAAALTVVAIGGSTTESFYISDGNTWPELVGDALGGALSGVWLNNAGLDGHSTFGHKLLLEDIIAPLRPDVMLVMAGWNDLGREEKGLPDLRDTKADWRQRRLREWVYLIANVTEVGGMALNFYRVYQARKMGLGHDVTFFDWAKAFTPVTVTDAASERILADHRGGQAAAYGERLRDMISTAKASGIRTVLITQSAAYGPDLDPRLGVALGDISARYGNGALTWRVLELYNDAARAVARESGALLIDLAAAMPKDTTYYYDPAHYNLPGSRKVAEIVAATLCPWLQAEFPTHVIGPCPAD